MRQLGMSANPVGKVSAIGESVPTQLARFPQVGEASQPGWQGFRNWGKRPNSVDRVSADGESVPTRLAGISNQIRVFN